MAYDVDRKSTVMFGGINQTDTWTWDGKWSLAHPTTTPPRSVGALVYDESLREVLFVDEEIRVWAWDGRDWTRVAEAGAPTALLYTGNEGTHVSAGYDPAVGALVVLANTWSTSPPVSVYDTWQWGASGWSKVGEATFPLNKGPDSANGELPFDAASKRLVSVGNGASSVTWIWNGAMWTRTPQPFWSGGPAAYDPAAGGVITSTACSGTSTIACGNGQHVWLLKAGAWTQLQAAGQAPADVEAVAYDQVRGILLAMGCRALACVPQPSPS